MSIATLVKNMWLVRYSWPVEIRYDQGVEFLGHRLKNILIENEYYIKTNPYYPGNSQAKSIIERIHQVLGNLV